MDAVYSARAAYETKHGKGVLPKVKAWREERSAEERDSLSRLHAAIGDSPEEAARWASEFGSSSPAPGRRKLRPDDALKSAAIRDAAKLLVSGDYERSSDILPAARQEVRAILRSVPGIGKVTADYFLMLLGHHGVKADVMVQRFLQRATDHTFTTDQAIAAVTATARAIDQPVINLEHAIWAFESARAKERSSGD